ncbi:MAG: 3-hydroxyanthranilate 3,4-dioxygenase [Deltaproteobacteria bacterium]|nr:3-hydroxyanthranilate 3,4-dioxygenase [Deltaproteobacteria bacterium]
MSRITPPLNFSKWIDEHRHLLKPPVGNQVVYKDTEFTVMVVGGPNTRKDYHVDEGEEFFYQLEGDMTLRIMEDGAPRDIPIRAGEIFLLPPKVPHSPQRKPETVGLVIERQRREGELDLFQWYCDDCHAKIYEEAVQLTDIVAQLPPIFERFWDNEANRKCDGCNAVMEPLN